MRQLLLLILLLNQGCVSYIVSCIDSKFERAVKPIDQEFYIELEFNDQQMSKHIKCERYYSALCAARGNYWEVREAGGVQSQFQFTDQHLGEVSISTPSCYNLLKEDPIPISHVGVTINDARYVINSSQGNIHTMSSWSARKSIKAKWQYKVNGAILE